MKQTGLREGGFEGKIKGSHRLRHEFLDETGLVTLVGRTGFVDYSTLMPSVCRPDYVACPLRPAVVQILGSSDARGVCTTRLFIVNSQVYTPVKTA